MASPRKTMPPAAAITGTLNWTVAAWVALRPRIAEYQIAYPIPDVSAPEAIAHTMPRVAGRLAGSMARFRTTANGAARRKFPAVVRVASPADLPRIE